MKTSLTLRIRDWKFSFKQLCAIIGITVLLISSITFVFSQTTFTPPNIYLDALPSNASYIVSTDGTNYWAINGTTGAIDHSNTNPAYLFRDILVDLTSGGNILVRAGTYVFLNDPTPPNIELTTSNISIIGAGMGITIFQPQVYVLGNFRLSGNYALINSAISNIHISGITFDYTDYPNKQAVGFRETTNLKIDHCEFIKSTVVNIVCTHSWFEHNYMHDAGTTINGIMHRGGRDIHVNYNSFANMGDDMIVTVPSGAEDGYGSQTQAENMEAIGNIGENSTNGNGIIFYAVKHGTASNNIFKDLNSGGIGTAIIQSVGNDVGWFDITISNNVIINSSLTAGIQLWASSGEPDICRRATITGNSIYQSFGGIYVFSSYDVVIDGNLVMNNTHHGIKLQGDRNLGVVGHTSHITVTDNILTNNTQYGIDLYSGSGYTGITEVLIKHNDLQWNGAGAFNLEGGGSVSNVELKHNKGYTTEKDGRSEASNDDWIEHSLAGTPDVVQLTVEEVDANYCIQLKASNSTHFQIYLYDLTAGAVETVDKTINWYAEYHYP